LGGVLNAVFGGVDGLILDFWCCSYEHLSGSVWAFE
jgi:hypothetical protein